MTVPTQKQVRTVADYKAAEERLRQVREEAVAGVKTAHDTWDLAAGNEWVSKLRKELDDFKAFRKGLPRGVLLSVNADRILESFSVDKDNFVNLVIPVDVSDEDAMHALNGRFREMFPEKDRAVIWEIEMDAILDVGNGSGRRSRVPRIIRLIGVVPDTPNMTRDQQAEALQQKGLTFPQPIEQALAAAAYACRCNGEDLFDHFWVRGSVPGFTLGTESNCGVCVLRDEGLCGNLMVAASGVPSSPFVKAMGGKPDKNF